MIVGFSSYGQGNGNAAADYLTDKDRTADREENPPEVIKGDMEKTTALINSLEFQHKYTSGVLSFSPDEKVTPEMEKAIIERFEQVAFAGLDKDRYDITWVRHSHAGHHELHFITPRVELETGKSFNIKPPGKETQAVYDDFRSEINARYGLSDPDDPARKRDIALSSGELKARLTDRIDVKETVNEILDRRVMAGTVQNRADVVDSLKELGFEINREGKNYLSIKDPESGEKFRLKGTMYERDFTVSGTLERQERAGARDYSKPDEARAGEFSERISAHISKRAEYNAGRYGPGNTEIFKDDIRAERLTALVSRDFPVSRHGDRDLAVYSQPEQGHRAALGRESESSAGSQQADRVTGGHDETLHERQRERVLYAGQSEQHERDRAEKEPQVRDIPERGETVNDRTGAESSGAIRSAFREVEDTAERNAEAVKDAGAESEKQGQQDRELIDAAQRFADTLRQHLAALERYVIARIAELKEKRLALATESRQKATTKPDPLPQKTQPERLPTIDGRAFDRLIVMPVIKNDGYEKTISFQASFCRKNEVVMEVKNLTKPELARMGVNPDDIKTKTSLTPLQLNSSRIESPLRYAERTLAEFRASMTGREFSAEEFKAMKVERARLENNAMQIRKAINADQKVKSEIDKSASKGMSI